VKRIGKLRSHVLADVASERRLELLDEVENAVHEAGLPRKGRAAS